MSSGFFGDETKEGVLDAVYEHSISHWYAAVIIATILWSALYWVLHLCDMLKSWEAYCRMVTVVHAVLITSMAAYSCVVDGPWPFKEMGGPNTRLQHWTCVLSMGYFIFDFAWCLHFRTEGPLMMIHHVLSIFGFYIVLSRGMHGTEMMATLFGTEITNPCLQLRWFVKQNDYYKDTPVLVLIDASFLILFSFFRVILATYYLYVYFHYDSTNIDALVRAGAVAIWAIGIAFWCSVVRYAGRKYISVPRQPLMEYSEYQEGDELVERDDGDNIGDTGYYAQEDSQMYEKSVPRGHVSASDSIVRHRSNYYDGENRHSEYKAPPARESSAQRAAARILVKDPKIVESPPPLRPIVANWGEIHMGNRDRSPYRADDREFVAMTRSVGVANGNIRTDSSSPTRASGVPLGAYRKGVSIADISDHRIGTH